MTIGTNINTTSMISSNIAINDTTPTLILEANTRRVKTVVQLDCDEVKVCVFVKETNDTVLEGELLVKDFLSNQNLYVPRLEINSNESVQHELYAIIDGVASDATTEMLHIVEYIG